MNSIFRMGPCVIGLPSLGIHRGRERYLVLNPPGLVNLHCQKPGCCTAVHFKYHVFVQLEMSFAPVGKNFLCQIPGRWVKMLYQVTESGEKCLMLSFLHGKVWLHIQLPIGQTSLVECPEVPDITCEMPRGTRGQTLRVKCPGVPDITCEKPGVPEVNDILTANDILKRALFL